MTLCDSAPTWSREGMQPLKRFQAGEERTCDGDEARLVSVWFLDYFIKNIKNLWQHKRASLSRTRSLLKRTIKGASGGSAQTWPLVRCVAPGKNPV